MWKIAAVGAACCFTLKTLRAAVFSGGIATAGAEAHTLWAQTSASEELNILSDLRWRRRCVSLQHPLLQRLGEVQLH